MKNQILFDKSAESFVREALGLNPNGEAMAYVKDKDTGKVKEINSVLDLLFLVSNDDCED